MCALHFTRGAFVSHSFVGVNCSTPPPPSNLLPRLTTPPSVDEAMNCLGFFLLSSLGICSLGVEEERSPTMEIFTFKFLCFFFVCAM